MTHSTSTAQLVQRMDLDEDLTKVDLKYLVIFVEHLCGDELKMLPAKLRDLAGLWRVEPLTAKKLIVDALFSTIRSICNEVFSCILFDILGEILSRP